jgi:hypothetical protein
VPTAATSSSTDYTAQLNGDVDFIRDTWFDFYKGINTANTVIAAAPTAEVPDATKAVRVGEARFLRALYYFWLVRTYGDIPIYTEPITEPKTETTREPVAKVYDLIIADLLAAEPRFRTRRRSSAGPTGRRCSICWRGLPDSRWRGDVVTRLRARRGEAFGRGEQRSLLARSAVRGPVAHRQRGQLGSRVLDPVHRRSAHHGHRQQAAPVLDIGVRPGAGDAARHRQRPSVPPLASDQVAARPVGPHEGRALRRDAQGHVDLEQPEQHPEGRRRQAEVHRG